MFPIVSHCCVAVQWVRAWDPAHLPPPQVTRRDQRFYFQIPPEGFRGLPVKVPPNTSPEGLLRYFLENLIFLCISYIRRERQIEGASCGGTLDT